MSIYNLTIDKFDETYARVEDLRKAGKLETKVDIASTLCILHPAAHSSAHANQITKELDVLARLNNVLERAYTKVINYLKK